MLATLTRHTRPATGTWCRSRVSRRTSSPTFGKHAGRWFRGLDATPGVFVNTERQRAVPVVEMPEQQREQNPGRFQGRSCCPVQRMSDIRDLQRPMHTALNIRRDPGSQNSRKHVDISCLAIRWPFAITGLLPGTAAYRLLSCTTRCRPGLSNITGSTYGAHWVEVGINHAR